MITLQPMTESSFAAFKNKSLESFARNLSSAEDISFEAAFANATAQFSRIAPLELATEGQLFFDVIDTASQRPVGFLWLGIKETFNKRIASVNDLRIEEAERNRGFGKAVMILAEAEALKHGAKKIRLHVFAHNTTAYQLYTKLGYQESSIDMSKDLSSI